MDIEMITGIIAIIFGVILLVLLVKYVLITRRNNEYKEIIFQMNCRNDYNTIVFKKVFRLLKQNGVAVENYFQQTIQEINNNYESEE